LRLPSSGSDRGSCYSWLAPDALLLRGFLVYGSSIQVLRHQDRSLKIDGLVFWKIKKGLKRPMRTARDVDGI
jgi:hypothetical protein